MTIKFDFSDGNFQSNLVKAAKDPKFVMTTKFGVRKKDGRLKGCIIYVLNLVLKPFRRSIASTNAEKSLATAQKTIESAREIFSDLQNFRNMHKILERTIFLARIDQAEKEKMMAILNSKIFPSEAFLEDAQENLKNLETINSIQPASELEKNEIKGKVANIFRFLDSIDSAIIHSHLNELAEAVGKYGSISMVNEVFKRINTEPSSKHFIFVKAAISGTFLSKNKEILNAIQQDVRSLANGEFLFHAAIVYIALENELDLSDDFFNFAFDFCKPTLQRDDNEVSGLFFLMDCPINKYSLAFAEKFLTRFPHLVNHPINHVHPILLAIANNSVALIELFLEKGANPNIQIPKLKLIQLVLKDPLLYPIAERLIKADTSKQTWLDAGLIEVSEKETISLEKVLERFKATYPLPASI
ncbi:putative uncharacterized protein [Parachlamydia acanthamoebae UV-7]|uniref:Ankyrin repeat protein n=2 Tax=Parachlamydia acanthamoebae TaxID=83552 RepID=F8KWS0_PARAV|nr:hypothetical protein [Parachlamydia acanthamoebae]KIA78036.1 hypothetical protein DB43_FB00040 [Parachlamydia acanthamoebae]CCB86214.1 putative uncharacterized protein [Parachlamydia acanthamoebae UV-7]